MLRRTHYKKGDQIGSRYLVHEVLMGGMGEVYLCLNNQYNYPVALKTFQARYLLDASVRLRFEEEVANWIKLEKHPNIVCCRFLETMDNLPFLVMDWIASDSVKGNDLRSWLRQGPLNLKQSLDFAIDICRGLIHANNRQPGIIHLDLKPDNVLIAQGRIAKITDFGLAAVAKQTGSRNTDDQSDFDGSRGMFVAGSIAGTPPYMAPEQWMDTELDARTDIYAIGCILYEMLVGQSPYVASTTDGYRHRHLKDPIPKLSKIATSHAGLDTLLACCLAKRANERFATVEGLLEELTLFYEQQFGELPLGLPPMEKLNAAEIANRGLTYFQLKRYDESFVDFCQAIQLDPDYANVYDYRGSYYTEIKHYNEALLDFNHALELNPELASAYHNRGGTYSRLHRYEEARTDLKHAIDINPTYAMAYVTLGTTYAECNHYPEALSAYAQAIALEPKRAEAFSNRGVVLCSLQRHDEALADHDRAIQLNPNLAIFYYNRADTYAKLKHYRQALEDYNYAVRLDSTIALVYIGRGILYYELQRFDEALADHTRAIEIDPTDAKAYNNRALTYRSLQRYQEALADLNKAITLMPASSEIYSNRGSTYSLLRRFDDAMSDFSRSIELDSTDAKSYLGRGLIYNELQRIEEALADLSYAVTLNPDLEAAFSCRANIYKSMQHYDMALIDFTELIRLAPMDASAYYNRGVIYFVMQRFEEALKDCTQAVHLDPTFARAYYNRGVIYESRLHLNEALAEYQQAIQYEPTLPHPYFNSGAVLSNQGALEKALPYFEKAAQLGLVRGRQIADQIREKLNLPSGSQDDLPQHMFVVFMRVDSLSSMRSTVNQYPLMMDAGFLMTVEQTIEEKVPAERKPAFMQRLTWLRQIIDEQG